VENDLINWHLSCINNLYLVCHCVAKSPKGDLAQSNLFRKR